MRVKPSAISFESDDEDDEDDEVALEGIDDEIYSVEKILAERDMGTASGETEYLVLWHGYPEEESTWEPKENFESGLDKIFKDWETEKEAVKQGFHDAFDVVAWEKRSQKYMAKQNAEISVPAPIPKKPLKPKASFEIFVPLDIDDTRRTNDTRMDDASISQEDAVIRIFDRKRAARAVGLEPELPKKLRKASSVSTSASISTSSTSNRLSRTSLNSTNSRPVAPSPGTPKKSSLVDRSKAAKMPVPAQNVFIPSGDKPVLRRERTQTTDDPQFLHLSHLWHMTKKAENGKAPDSQNVLLFDPSTMKNGSYQQKRESIITVDGNNRSPTNASAAQQPQQPHNATPSSYSATAHTIPLKCHYYHSGWTCPDGELSCRFMHNSDDLPIASTELQAQARLSEDQLSPKFLIPPIVCGHHYRNKQTQGCFRSPEQCFYAHWKPLMGWVYHDHQKRPTRTCSFWQAGKCFKSDEECEFAHRTLSDTAIPPPISTKVKSSRTCPYWLGPGGCFKSDEECIFAHQHLDIAEPLNVHLSRFDMTCPFWLEKRCHKPAEICKFAHEIKPWVASKDRSGPVPLDPTRLALLDIDTHSWQSPLAEPVPLTQPMSRWDVRAPDKSAPPTVPGAPLPYQVMPMPNSATILTDQNMEGLIEVVQSPIQGEVRNPILDTPATSSYPSPRTSIQEQAGNLPRSMSMLKMGGSEQPATNIVEWFRKTLKVKPDMLFAWIEKPLPRNVCLMYPLDQRAEADVLSRFLREAGARVYIAYQEGAWRDFRGKLSGTVIFSSRVNDYKRIPGLAAMFMTRFNFFEFGTIVDHDSQFLKFKKLFPGGTMVFLTDQAVDQEPENTMRVIGHIKENNENKQPGHETWRIFGRPKLLEWLRHLADKHTDTSRYKLWQEINQLHETFHNVKHLGPSAYIVSEPFGASDHSSEYEKDPIFATQKLIVGFNEYFEVYRERWRRWVVVYPDARMNTTWGKEYENLNFRTPTEYMEKLAGSVSTKKA